MVEIKKVSKKNVDHLIEICLPFIPAEEQNKFYFIEGIKAKKRWAMKMLAENKNFAKLAYIKSKLVGLIHYGLDSEYNYNIMEIDCIVVLKEHQRKGIGKLLFKSLLDECDANSVFAIVTHAFQTEYGYSQPLFYKNMGFEQVSKNDPFLLYYPIKKDFVYKPKPKKYIPQKEDRGKAIIFFSSFCPFAIYFLERIGEIIKEIIPDICIRRINKLEEPGEIEKRCAVTTCIVNMKPIKASFFDKEKFQKEVKEAWDGK